MQGKQNYAEAIQLGRQKIIDILRDKRTCGSHEAIKEYYFKLREKRTPLNK